MIIVCKTQPILWRKRGLYYCYTTPQLEGEHENLWNHQFNAICISSLPKAHTRSYLTRFSFHMFAVCLMNASLRTFQVSLALHTSPNNHTLHSDFNISGTNASQRLSYLSSLHRLVSRKLFGWTILQDHRAIFIDSGEQPPTTR